MRLAVVSHSLVAERQKRFFDYMNRFMDVLQVYPHTWGPEEREGGYRVHGEGYMANFIFPNKAKEDIQEFDPDIIYVQDEFWTTVTSQMSKMSTKLGCKLVVFIWENLKGYNFDQSQIVRRTDLIICGNRKAEELVRPYNERTVVLPQVGVDCDLFKPMDTPKEYDFAFMGRYHWSKGVKVIEKALEDLPDVNMFWNFRERRAPYEKIPERLNRARTLLTPSIDTLTWKEQFAPYVNIEALACGLGVIASNSEAMVEWLGRCPAVRFVEQNSVEELKRTMQSRIVPSWTGRAFVEERFSIPVVAKRLMEELVSI